MFKLYVLNTYTTTTLTREVNGNWVLFGIKHSTSGQVPTVWVPNHIESPMAQPGVATTITLDQLLSRLPTAALREFVSINRYVMTYIYNDGSSASFSAARYSYAPANHPIFDAIDKECLFVMAAEGSSASQSPSDLSTKYANLYAEHADLLAKYEKIKKVFE